MTPRPRSRRLSSTTPTRATSGSEPMPAAALPELVTLAIDAALAAGREILDVYAGPIAVERKQDASPLTEPTGVRTGRSPPRSPRPGCRC